MKNFLGELSEDQARNEFIAILAHELRNPLAPVKSTLEYLAMQDLEPESAKMVTSAHQQVDVVRRLLDDLLDITRVSQGRFQLQMEDVHLCSIIGHSIEITQELFKERHHNIVMSPTCNDSLWLHADPVRLEQALVNILNNAAKYSNPGSTITILCEIQGKMLSLSVADGGMGIDGDKLDKIFEPFWQLRNGTRAGGGVGIGLSLTKHIVEAHGGSIIAKSDGIGTGSTFTLNFPLSEDPLKPRVEKQVPIPPSIGSFDILVVDDNKVAALALAKLLTLHGHTAYPVFSGEEAIEKVKGHAPDVVLLDIGMPGMSGYETATQLRIEGYKGGLVALTGYGQHEDRKKALEVGFDYHLTKPASVGSIEEFLSTRQKDMGT